jgi:hypothetical protein
LLAVILFVSEFVISGILVAVIAFFLFPSSRGQNQGYHDHHYHSSHDDYNEDTDRKGNDDSSYDGGDSDFGGSDD